MAACILHRNRFKIDSERRQGAVLGVEVSCGGFFWRCPRAGLWKRFAAGRRMIGVSRSPAIEPRDRVLPHDLRPGWSPATGV